MIFGMEILNEIDYTIKGGAKPPKENDYTLNTGDGDTEPENDNQEDTPDDEGENTDTENQEDDTTDDYTIDNEDPPTDTDNNTGDENDVEGGNDTGENDDYTIDGNNEGEDDIDTGETGEGDDTTDEPVDDMGDENIDNELVQKEKELFNKLSPEEMDIKNKELKTNFQRMYDAIEDIKTKIKRIPINVNIQNVIDFATRKINETQDDITHYLYYTYDNKSYIQNMKQYNIYLLILKSIEQLFNEITVKNK